MADRESVIRKIRALLAKEGAEGTTPEEVAAAISRANRLLEREGLTRAALEAEGASPAESAGVEKDPLFVGDRVATWRIRLAAVVSNAHGCVLVSSRGVGLLIAGRPSDVEIVRYLFSYCAGEIDRLTAQQTRGLGRTYANNFRLGCCDAISGAIAAEIKAEREAQRAAAAGTSALVAVDNAIARLDARRGEADRAALAHFGRLRAAPQRRSRYDDGAREHGRSAGSGIYPGRRSGVGSGAPRKRLGVG